MTSERGNVSGELVGFEQGGTAVMSVRAFARTIGTGPGTAYALIREGRVKVLTYGRRIMVPRAEVVRFISENAAPLEARPA